MNALGEAALLGVVHGPAELLPISSSGHLALLPWLLGSGPRRGPEDEKLFQVALHAGTAAALLLALRGEARTALRELSGRQVGLLILTTAPAAVAGLTLKGPIERRLGTPVTVAGGLIAGSLAMAAADRSGQARQTVDAGVTDALTLGLAQTLALAPGVSRGGATLAAARWRGFSRAAAARLSRDAALPVIAGATILELATVGRRSLAPDVQAQIMVGATCSFASALVVAGRLSGGASRRSLTPFVLYRLTLAIAVLLRAQRSG